MKSLGNARQGRILTLAQEIAGCQHESQLGLSYSVPHSPVPTEQSGEGLGSQARRDAMLFVTATLPSATPSPTSLPFTAYMPGWYPVNLQQD